MIDLGESALWFLHQTTLIEYLNCDLDFQIDCMCAVACWNGQRIWYWVNPMKVLNLLLQSKKSEEDFFWELERLAEVSKLAFISH